MQKRGRKGNASKYSISFMRQVVADYVNGDQSLRQVARKYGIVHQLIGEWKTRFSSDIAYQSDIIAMTEEEQKELEALKKQMQALEKKLDYEKMRNFALETMLDLAKEQLGVDVRKNFGAKQREQ